MTVSRSGYTLIEVLVVLVLIAIMAGMAVPRLDISGYRADSAMNAVGSTLLAAQRIATAKGHSIVVAFDAPGKRLRIHDDANNNGRIDPGERVRYEVLGDGVSFGRGSAPEHWFGSAPITFTRTQDGLPAVTFYRSGSASEEGGFYLSAAPGQEAASALNVRAIVIDRGTGRVSWFRYSPSGWTRGY